ncbi:neprilysin-1-like [Periplaneta americana]|uniref:neprilysin-1-like n=1 Tax=Periplaneta americana TaxID=6978 RepID=UPI0037E8931F
MRYKSAKLQVLGLQGPACGNEKCIQSAYSILESIDRRVDPCEDFYEFACGNWGRAHPVSEAEISNTWFNERSQFLVRRLKDLLQENGTSSEPRAVKEAKFFFAACKDIDTLEDLGLEPIMEILGNLSLPRQIPDSKTAAGWDIATTLAKAQKLLSLDTLVQLGPDVDSSDNEKLILSLSPPTEARPLVGALVSDPEEMPRAARISNKEIVKARFSYMSGILGEMDAWGKTDDDTKHNDSYISAAVFKILIFSAEVSEGISEEVTNSSSNNNAKMTLSTLQSIMDFKIKDAKYKHKIIWKNYMTALLEGTGVSFDVDNDILSVTDVTYFLNLAVVISKSRLETVQRYVWWQVVHLLAIHTNKAMRNLRNQMLEQIFGSIDSPSRSTVCLKRVKKLMPMAISYTLASEEDVISTVSKNVSGNMFQKF